MSSRKRAWVAATLDTKAAEAEYVCDLLEAAGLPVTLADLSTTPNLSRRSPTKHVLMAASEIAAHHPKDKTLFFWATGVPRLRR
jgi:uncharacterized protein (UPF0261 family)